MHTTSSLFPTVSSPLRFNSLYKCIASNTHSLTPNFTPTDTCRALCCFFHSTLTHSHFLFLFTGSQNEILSGNSNRKCWANNSRKLVQVPLSLQTERRKICSILTVLPLPTKWNMPLIFSLIPVLTKNQNNSFSRPEWLFSICHQYSLQIRKAPLSSRFEA